MEDLRTTLESAVQEHSEPESVTPATTEAPLSNEPQSPVTSEEKAPDVGMEGSEKIAPTKTIADKPKPIEEVVSEKPPTESAPAVDSPARIDRAPASWKGDSKKVWADLPLGVRQEVIKREREIVKGLNEAAVERKSFDSVRQAVAPHMERINALYQGNAVSAIEGLLNVERQLHSGTARSKAEIAANMIKTFNIDITMLDSLLVGGDPVESPQSSLEQLLEQKLKPFQQFIQSQQQQAQQQTRALNDQAVHTIESMALDPQYPYFEEVRQDMADLIETAAKRGLYLSLEQAYTKAVRMNDDTFQATTARSSSQAATEAAMQAHQTAQRAKGASVSVSGNPAGGAKGEAVDASNLRGTIESLWSGSGERV